MLKKSWLVVLMAVMLLVGIGAVGYSVNAIYLHPQDRPWVRGVVTALHLSAARVEGESIRYQEYLDQQDAMRVFLKTPEAKEQGAPTEVDANAKRVILEQLIRGAAVQAMAKDAKIELTDADVNRSYDELLARAGTSTDPGEVASYLFQTFGWTEAEFKQRVVRPATLETAVRQEVYKNDDTAFEAALKEKMDKAVKYVRE